MKQKRSQKKKKKYNNNKKKPKKNKRVFRWKTEDPKKQILKQHSFINTEIIFRSKTISYKYK